MPKFNFKNLKKSIKVAIGTVTTLAAVLAIWRGSEMLDNATLERAFKNLPKTQQQYVDSLRRTGNISKNTINGDIVQLNRIKSKLLSLQEEVDAIGIQLNKLPKNATFEKGAWLGKLKHFTQIDLNAARGDLEGIIIFDKTELKVQIAIIQENINLLIKKFQ